MLCLHNEAWRCRALDLCLPSMVWISPLVIRFMVPMVGYSILSAERVWPWKAMGYWAAITGPLMPSTARNGELQYWSCEGWFWILRSTDPHLVVLIVFGCWFHSVMMRLTTFCHSQIRAYRSPCDACCFQFRKAPGCGHQWPLHWPGLHGEDAGWFKKKRAGGSNDARAIVHA